jgi:hypothetical protein
MDNSSMHSINTKTAHKLLKLVTDKGKLEISGFLRKGISGFFFSFAGIKINI